MRRRTLGVKPLTTEVMQIRTWIGTASGAGPAPVDAQYVVLAVNTDLTQERVLTAGNSITVTDAGAGSTVTVALATPGACAVASTNSAVAPHTHAVTSSSNPGAAASILASAADGGLQLIRLGIGVDPDTDNAVKVVTATWVGLGAAAGRIVFADLATDQVQLAAADLYLPTGLGVIHADGVVAGTVLRANGTRFVPGAIATGDVAALAAQFVCLAASGDLANERVLTAGNSISITDGGAGLAVTVALATPGTCTATSTNSAVAPHTHAITTTAVGAASTIMATDANSRTQVTGLGIGVAAGAANQITMVNGGTIGQAAGPLLTFDDTLNYLEITGCYVGIGTATPGTALEVNGTVYLNNGSLFAEAAAGANTDNIIVRHDGAPAANLVSWTLSVRANNEDFLLYGYDGTGAQGSIYCDFSTGFVGIAGRAGAPAAYSVAPDAPLDVNHMDDATAAVANILILDHESSGVAAALFGTGIAFQMESSTTASQDAANIAALWSDATHASRNALLRFNSLTVGTAIGYTGIWSGNDVAAVAITVIPNGAGDVTGLLFAHYVVIESAGGTAASSTTVAPGASANIYADGTDTLALAVAADGSVTVQRTAGAATFDVVLWLVWI